MRGFPGGSLVKNPFANAGDVDLIPGTGRSPRRRKWQSIPVFMLGKSHGHRSLIGYSPWGRKESDTTEQLVFIFIYKETTQFINGPKTFTDISPKKIYRWQIST